MAMCEKILIAGFSGAGKSSLLRHLAQHPRGEWSNFSDLDQLILKQHGRGLATLSGLIEAAGWEKFRTWERQTLEGWLKEEGKGILALGGGTLSPLVWELFGKNPRLKFCHLNISFASAWKRLIQDSQEPRPLVRLGELELKRIYDERMQLFQKIPWQLDGEWPLEQVASAFWQELS